MQLVVTRKQEEEMIEKVRKWSGIEEDSSSSIVKLIGANDYGVVAIGAELEQEDGTTHRALSLNVYRLFYIGDTLELSLDGEYRSVFNTKDENLIKLLFRKYVEHIEQAILYGGKFKVGVCNYENN